MRVLSTSDYCFTVLQSFICMKQACIIRYDSFQQFRIRINTKRNRNRVRIIQPKKDLFCKSFLKNVCLVLIYPRVFLIKIFCWWELDSEIGSENFKRVGVLFLEAMLHFSPACITFFNQTTSASETQRSVNFKIFTALVAKNFEMELYFYRYLCNNRYQRLHTSVLKLHSTRSALLYMNEKFSKLCSSKYIFDTVSLSILSLFVVVAQKKIHSR